MQCSEEGGLSGEEVEKLQGELEAARADKSKVEKEVVHEFESENRKINANISKLEEQVRASLSLISPGFYFII